MTLADALAAAAAATGASATTDADGAMTWTIGGTVIAVLSREGSTAEFRLDPVLAGAARRTPDVASSERGEMWVRFAPRLVDGHAVDRATAWFEAAVRRAGDDGRG